ncbi:hypothetical protein MPH_14000, partial [Macrophomina phaseolina MS6]
IRPFIFTDQNIRSGFQAIGLIPYDPQRVLSSLTVTKTPSPPHTPNGEAPPWTSETPHTIAQLEQQARLVRDLIQRQSQSPTSQAVNQLIRGCQMAMHLAVVLAKENSELRKESQRRKQKQQYRRRYIAQGGVLQAQQGQFLVERMDNRDLKANQNEATNVQQRAPPTCSSCHVQGHTMRQCLLFRESLVWYKPSKRAKKKGQKATSRASRPDPPSTPRFRLSSPFEGFSDPVSGEIGISEDLPSSPPVPTTPAIEYVVALRTHGAKPHLDDETRDMKILQLGDVLNWLEIEDWAAATIAGVTESVGRAFERLKLCIILGYDKLAQANRPAMDVSAWQDLEKIEALIQRNAAAGKRGHQVEVVCHILPAVTLQEATLAANRASNVQAAAALLSDPAAAALNDQVNQMKTMMSAFGGGSKRGRSSAITPHLQEAPDNIITELAGGNLGVLLTTRWRCQHRQCRNYTGTCYHPADRDGPHYHIKLDSTLLTAWRGRNTPRKGDNRRDAGYCSCPSYEIARGNENSQQPQAPFIGTTPFISPFWNTPIRLQESPSQQLAGFFIWLKGQTSCETNNLQRAHQILAEGEWDLEGLRHDITATQWAGWRLPGGLLQRLRHEIRRYRGERLAAATTTPYPRRSEEHLEQRSSPPF